MNEIEALLASCHRCVFFRIEDSEGGRCHRYPPSAVTTYHPRVAVDQWCGEYVDNTASQFHPDKARPKCPTHGVPVGDCAKEHAL